MSPAPGAPTARRIATTIARRPASDPASAARPPWSRRRLLLAAAILVAGVLGLHAWLELVGPLPGERWANDRFLWYQLPREPVGQLVLFFDVAGRPVVALCSVGVATWLVARSLGRRAAVLLVVAFAGVLLNDVVKAELGPTPLWSTKPEIGTDANFPSGHAFYAASFGGALLRLAWLRRRPDLVVLAAVLIGLSGPARVIQGVHLPSDVLAGYGLGLAWLLVAVVLVGRTVPAGTRPRTVGRGGVPGSPRPPVDAVVPR